MKKFKLTKPLHTINFTDEMYNLIKDYAIRKYNNKSEREAIKKYIADAINRQMTIDDNISSAIPVIQLNDNGDKINSFVSIKKASEETGISYWGIRDCIRGKQKHAGGYRWIKEK